MIRAATAADAPAVARVEIRARALADERLDPDVLEPPPRPGAVVAEVEGRLVGFAAVGDDGLVLAVDPLAQGAGLGAALLQDRCRAEAPSFAWVPERDGLAVAFLTARGWRPDGERRERDGAPEIRMVPCAS